MKPKIVTSHEYPPIPIREFDWCAHREGHEEDGNYGWGATEQEAISDLLKIEYWNDELKVSEETEADWRT